MSARQLCFFKFPRPLVERFGKSFFSDIPAVPGVYMMTDRSERVLYIGQSRNLRVRLAYYKNAQPEREPRKVIRLVCETEAIRWERCESPEEALERELELIREHHPKFNRAHNRPPASTFFHLARGERAFGLRISSSGLAREGEKAFGPLKNQALCRAAFLAVGRLFWLHENPVKTAYDFPLWLHERSRTTEFRFSHSDKLDLLEEVLTGRSPALLEEFPEQTDPCLRSITEAGMMALAEFHEFVRRQSGPAPAYLSGE